MTDFPNYKMSKISLIHGFFKPKENALRLDCVEYNGIKTLLGSEEQIIIVTEPVELDLVQFLLDMVGDEEDVKLDLRMVMLDNEEELFDSFKIAACWKEYKTNPQSKHKWVSINFKTSELMKILGEKEDRRYLIAKEIGSIEGFCYIEARLMEAIE